MARTAALSALAALTLLASACVGLTGYSGYLDHKDYDQGLTVARRELAADPDDADSNYWAGRFLLAKDDAAAALPLLQRAADLEPGDADKQFWLGVACWGVQDFDRELAQYRRALELDPRHLSANLYLGHAYLDRGRLAPALAQYDKVLELDPYEPGALYNRAVVLAETGRRAEAVEALLRFLDAYPEGRMGAAAADLLNTQGDFTYRNARLGRRTVTLRAVRFAPGGTDLAFGASDSLDVVGSMLANNPALAVHVVVYVQGDAALARDRARRIRSFFRTFHPAVREDQLDLSWFGAAEDVEAPGGPFALKESVLFITKVPATN
ncbi:MAG: tetratricopeptide repeat protein [Desulfovibrionaceae bacterium]